MESLKERDLDEIEAQLDSTVPYYVPRLIAEIRKLRREASEALGVSPPAEQKCALCGGKNPIICNRCHGMVAYAPIVSASSGVSPSGGWQPVDEYTRRDITLLFWVRPLSEDETYRDGSGNPIMSSAAKPRHHIGKYGTWSSLETATHWQPYVLPAPPASPSLPREASSSSPKHVPVMVGYRAGEPATLDADDEPRLREQFIAVSTLLSGAGIGPCSIVQGVRDLIDRLAHQTSLREQAEAGEAEEIRRRVDGHV